MLVVRRAEKTETLVALYHAYCTQVVKKIGVFEEKQNIFMHHSKLESALFNRVLGCEDPSNVLNCAALLEHAKAFNKKFLWMLHDSNVNLLQYLLTQDLDRREPEMGFYFNLNWRMPNYESHPAVSLLEVESEEQFYEWSAVFAECHGISFEDVCDYFSSGYGDDRCYSLYMAQVYQKTIGCSAMFVHEKNALLLWDSVLPMYRRQGVGSMMALSRMKQAKALECENVYAVGMESFAAMLRDIGFRSFAKFQVLCYGTKENHRG
jgi:hypothetical protein